MLSDISAAAASCGSVEPPDKMLINCENPLTIEVSTVCDSDPGGATPTSTSATAEPLLTPPTLVTEAIRSGRTDAT